MEFPSIPEPLIAVPKLLVVPIMWGDSWRTHTPYDLFDVLRCVLSIMSSHYLDGLGEYNIAPGGAFEYGAFLADPAGEVPNPFGDGDCWKTIDRAIDKNLVKSPAEYDQPAPVGARFRTVYALFIAPNHYYTDPNVFGKNWTDYRPGAAAAWVSCNSNLAGAVTTFAHELIEGGSGAQIADDCETESFSLDGLLLPKYKVDGVCWPDAQTQLSWLEEKLASERKVREGFLGPRATGLTRSP